MQRSCRLTKCGEGPDCCRQSWARIEESGPLPRTTHPPPNTRVNCAERDRETRQRCSSLGRRRTITEQHHSNRTVQGSISVPIAHLQQPVQSHFEYTPLKSIGVSPLSRRPRQVGPCSFAGESNGAYCNPKGDGVKRRRQRPGSSHDAGRIQETWPPELSVRTNDAKGEPGGRTGLCTRGCGCPRHPGHLGFPVLRASATRVGFLDSTHLYPTVDILVPTSSVSIYAYCLYLCLLCGVPKCASV